MSKHNIKIDKNKNLFKIHVVGQIDENVDFSPYSLAGADSVELYLGSMVQINSWGIREWIRWLATAGSTPISYFECPQSVIEQVNTIRGFLPSNAKVMSFYVPYHSDSTGEERSVLYVYGKHFDEKGLLNFPTVLEKDGTHLKIDVIESKYFRFLTRS